MRHVTLCLAICLGLAACQKDSATAPKTQAAAQVGNITITQADVDQALELLNEDDRHFAQTPLGKQNLLQVLTREKLILADARATGLEQEKDYQQAIRQKRAELDRAYAQFEQDALLRTWYEKNGAQLEPTEKEIKAYFDQYPYEMTLKQIIIDNAQTADQVLRTLKASPGRWNEMARQYSIAPKHLQILTVMPGEYLENLEVIAANSPIGKAQGFFKTPLGFHIIMKTGENKLSLKQAEPRIKQVLQQQRIDELLETLKNTYEVTIYDENK